MKHCEGEIKNWGEKDYSILSNTIHGYCLFFLTARSPENASRHKNYIRVRLHKKYRTLACIHFVCLLTRCRSLHRGSIQSRLCSLLFRRSPFSNRGAWIILAVWAEPFALWYCIEWRIWALQVIRSVTFIALERRIILSVVFVTDYAEVRCVHLLRVPGHFWEIVSWLGEENGRVLNRGDTMWIVIEALSGVKNEWLNALKNINPSKCQVSCRFRWAFWFIGT